MTQAVRVRRERRAPAISDRERAIIERAKDAVADNENQMFAEMYVTAIEKRVLENDETLWKFLRQLEQIPVSIETFLDSPQFLGATDLNIWPEVRKAIIEINQDWWKGTSCRSSHMEAILAGATSVAKTTIAQITTLYHTHLLGCLIQPQNVYGLPKTTSIVFPIIAAKPNVTKKVVYMPMRKMLEEIPWFATHMKLDKDVESEAYFPEKNIRIYVGGADSDSVLGEAVIGGIVDEINFMNVVLRSKKAEVSTGRPGVYDQAQNIYETITRRKKSRFITQGPMIGIVCVSSSTRYKGDFTDKRMEYVAKNKETNVYVYCKKQYEVWPQDRYCGEKFRLLVGNDVLSDTRVLKDGEKVPEGSLVLEVPIEYKSDFEKNPHDSLRDVVGISTSSISPFFRRRFKIYECIETGREEGLESFLLKDNVILGVDGMPQIKRGHYCANPSRPRYVHIDLSLTGDRCGIAMIRFDGLKKVEREGGSIEMLPEGTVELACSIEPDANHEIQIAEVRTWVKRLRDEYGYPIKVVTYDGYMGRESMQQWKKDGMKTGNISVDRTSVPYKQFRDGIMDGRIKLVDNPILTQELFDLEYDELKDLVDHPVNGSKDVADAVCGAFTVMLERRSSWTDASTDDQAIEQNKRSVLAERYSEARRA